MLNKVGFKVAVMVNLVLLVVMAGGSFYLIQKQSQSLEAQVLARGKIESILGAKMVGKVLDEAIDNGVFAVGEAFDTNYEEIPGFNPAKYHTVYDSYLDKAILALEDEFLKDESLEFAVAVDRNGYLPTHNTRYQQGISGDQGTDLSGNRTKRMFNDPIGIKSARNQQEAYLQVYKRDTGEVMWDISSPIFVKGKHWGGFRVAVSLRKMKVAESELRGTLFTIMGGLLLVSILAVFLVVDYALKPLGKFTQIAGELADGKMDQEIVSTSHDEIGKLADVLERLRVSLKMAMDRLSRK